MPNMSDVTYIYSTLLGVFMVEPVSFGACFSNSLLLNSCNAELVAT